MRMSDGFFRDIPFWQKRFDYGARDDGQPVYRGYVVKIKGTDEDGWIIFFTKFNVDGFIIEEYSLEGVWDDRVALFADVA